MGAVYIFLLLAVTTPAFAAFTVHFIDVGQGDATLITCDGESMMIDFGDNSRGTYLQNYLRKQNVETLKYAIGTHPDADHIGGMDVILQKIRTDTVMMPDAVNDTATYRDVVDVCRWRDTKSSIRRLGKSTNWEARNFRSWHQTGTLTVR